MGIDAQMFVKTKQQISQEQLKNLAYELASAYGAKNFVIDREKKWEGRHCLYFIDEYMQDGDSLFPEAGEIFIEVNLRTRYYGVNYERGNLPLILSIAEWLERKIINCEVWYGGDSSGIEAVHLTKQERNNLFNHFVNVGHNPYYYFFDGEHEECCTFCDKPMLQYGFGNNYSAFRCTGCGYCWEKRDGKVVMLDYDN